MAGRRFHVFDICSVAAVSPGDSNRVTTTNRTAAERNVNDPQRKEFVEFAEHAGLLLVQVSVHLHKKVGTVIAAGEIAVDFVEA